MLSIRCLLLLFAHKATSQPSNILLIIADDLRPELRCYGNNIVKTPNIDKLVRKSAQFHNAHTQFAMCGPSRTSFLTSRRPDTLTVFDQSRPYWRTLPGNFTSLPQFFKEAKIPYQTVSLGKIFHPSELSGKTDDYPFSWSQPPYHPPTHRYKNAKVCPDAEGGLHANIICPVDVKRQPGGTLPDIETADEAVKQLDRLSQQAEPFFLAVGFHKPHIPLKYPKRFEELYKDADIAIAVDNKKPPLMPSVSWNPFMDVKSREDVAKLNISFPYGEIPHYFQKEIIKSYYAAISYMDDMVGKVIASVDKHSLWNNTIIVFMSDHGWSLGEHAEWSKFSNFDVATRVPLSVYTPPNIIENSTKHVYDMVELVDLFPTLVQLAGWKPLKRCTDTITTTCTEGKSLVPLLEGWLTDPYRANVSFTQYPRPSLTPQPNSDQPSHRDIKYMGYSVKSTQYRYVAWVSFNASTQLSNLTDIAAEELYNVFKDPREDNNLIKYLPLKGRELYHLLLKADWRNYRR